MIDCDDDWFGLNVKDLKVIGLVVLVLGILVLCLRLLYNVFYQILVVVGELVLNCVILFSLIILQLWCKKYIELFGVM